jgi:hypothetical protein
MPDMRGRYERTPEIRARVAVASRIGQRRAYDARHAVRLGQVYEALPGTIYEVMEKVGFSYGTTRHYLQVLEEQGVAKQSRVHNRWGYGYANYWEEIKLKERA